MKHLFIRWFNVLFALVWLKGNKVDFSAKAINGKYIQVAASRFMHSAIKERTLAMHTWSYSLALWVSIVNGGVQITLGIGDHRIHNRNPFTQLKTALYWWMADRSTREWSTTTILSREWKLSSLTLTYYWGEEEVNVYTVYLRGRKMFAWVTGR